MALAVPAVAFAGGRTRVRQEMSEQDELEVSSWLVALVALGSVGVLVGFWGLAAWGLYALFA